MKLFIDKKIYKPMNKTNKKDESKPNAIYLQNPKNKSKARITNQNKLSWADSTKMDIYIYIDI